MAKSKKYIGKLCVYCRDAVSTTADHVFPREMFQISQRHMLPKVPSCNECNNKKSQIEHYLLSVLPFGATHQNAKQALSVDVRKRLVKNKKLHNEIREGFGDSYIRVSETTIEKRLRVKFDSEQLHEFISYVGLGLNWHYWEQYLPNNYSFVSFTPSPTGMEFITGLFNLSSNLRVNELLGEDTVRCKGIMSEVDSGISVWGVQLLGGMTVVDEEQGKIFKNSLVAMITGKPDELEKLNLNSTVGPISVA